MDVKDVWRCDLTTDMQNVLVTIDTDIFPVP